VPPAATQAALAARKPVQRQCLLLQRTMRGRSRGVHGYGTGGTGGTSGTGGGVCTAGKCSGCGASGQPCCGTTCGAGLSCRNNTCSSCGNAGEACCPGTNGASRCVAGTVCNSTSSTTTGLCALCGSRVRPVATAIFAAVAAASMAAVWPRHNMHQRQLRLQLRSVQIWPLHLREFRRAVLPDQHLPDRHRLRNP